MNSIEFRAALRDLENGKLPNNKAEAIKYAEDTVLETRQLVASLTECAKRQEMTIRLLRAWSAGQKRQTTLTPQPPQWVGPSAELIPGSREG